MAVGGSRFQNPFLLLISFYSMTSELSFCELEIWMNIRLKITFTSVIDGLVTL